MSNELQIPENGSYGLISSKRIKSSEKVTDVRCYKSFHNSFYLGSWNWWSLSKYLYDLTVHVRNRILNSWPYVLLFETTLWPYFLYFDPSWSTPLEHTIKTFGLVTAILIVYLSLNKKSLNSIKPVHVTECGH